jgi:hypothetical protein
VAQDVGPEFKPKYHKKPKNTHTKKHKSASKFANNWSHIQEPVLCREVCIFSLINEMLTPYLPEGRKSDEFHRANFALSTDKAETPTNH